MDPAQAALAIRNPCWDRSRAGHPGPAGRCTDARIGKSRDGRSRDGDESQKTDGLQSHGTLLPHGHEWNQHIGNATDAGDAYGAAQKSRSA
jgi:hypothetical protein